MSPAKSEQMATPVLLTMALAVLYRVHHEMRQGDASLMA